MRTAYSQKQIGAWGEKIAQNYLQKKGYKILGVNYVNQEKGNPQKGEIDIIAQKGDIISFIEVKTLTALNNIIAPEDKVVLSKRKKIIKAAETYLLSKKYRSNIKWQIDIIGIEINKDLSKAGIRHLQNI